MIKLITILAFLLAFPGLTFSQSEPSWEERSLTDNDHNDRYASYSPKGQWILFESDRDGNWEIYVMDSEGNHPIRLTNNEFEDRRPCWHPSGKKILFESIRNGDTGLYSLNVKNRKVKKLKYSHGDGDYMFASYSPSGKKIAVSLKKSEQESNIVLLTRKGKSIRTLVENGWRNFYPRWSNDGKKIVYFSRKDTQNEDDEIYCLDLGTTQELRLTNWPQHNFCPSWSFDDSQIVYVTSMENTRPEIYVMDNDGKHKVRITHNEDGETLPNWHPSANKMLMTAYRDGNYEICELSLKQ